MNDVNKEIPVNAEDKLDHVLTMLAAGIPADEILADAGEDVGWLQPMLAIAGDVEQLQQSVPLPPPDSSLERMLAHAETLAPAAPPSRSGLLTTLLSALTLGRSPVAMGIRSAVLAASLVVAFLAGSLLGGSLSLAAYDSLPGQPFYGLKRTTENLRLGLTFNAERRERLLQTYNRRRQLEAQLLLDQGQEEIVNFEDVIATIEEGRLRIDGLTVEITPETDIDGELTPGARVRVEAITQPPDLLRALVITVLQPGPPTPTPSPSPSPAATAQPTASPAPNQTGDTIDMNPPPADDDLPDDALDELDDSINQTDDVPEIEDAREPDDNRDDDEDSDDEDSDNEAGDDEFDDEDQPGDNGDDDFDEGDDDLDDNENENKGDDEDDFDEDSDNFNDNRDDDNDNDFDEGDDDVDDFDDFNDNEDELDNGDDDFDEDDDFEDEEDFDEEDFDDEDSSDDDNSGSDGGDDSNSGSGGDDDDNSGSGSDDDGDDDEEDEEDEED